MTVTSMFRMTGVADASIPYADLAAGEYRLYFSATSSTFCIKDNTNAVIQLGGLSTEQIQDMIGSSFLGDSTDIDVTYDDAGNAESAVIKAFTGDIAKSAGSLATLINDNVVTNAKLRDSVGTSVIGRSGGTTGDPADIAAGADDTLLHRRGGSLQFAALDDAAHGNRGGSALHAAAVAGGANGFLTGADKTKLDGITAGANLFTTEDAQDAAGALLQDSATLDVTYNDAGNAETASVITTGLDYVVSGVPGTRGVMYGKDKKKIDGAYYDAVADLGLDPSGTTGAATNVTALQNWHDNTIPAAGGATLFLPDNCFIALNAVVNFSKADICIQSNNRRTSGFVLTSATANGFTCSGDNIQFEKVRFIAGTPSGTAALRTAGFAVEFTSSGDSGGCRECDFIYMWSCVRLSGSLQWVDECTMREYGANATNGACVLVDGVGDRYIRRLTTDSTVPSAGHAGVRVTATASLIIDACNIIHAGLALDLAPANGITIPSIEATNTFFDTSVVGINCTGAGSVLRCKFTNCWIGSMSDSGIKLGPTGSGTVEGLEFVNCDILNNVAGTTVCINITTALVGKVRFIGCHIAGWTTGVVTTAGTNCWPMFHECTVGQWGAFGVNTTGFNIGAGTYKGLFIIACDAADSTTPLTLGAVVVAAGGGNRFRIVDNAGINPRGSVGAITVPGSTVAAVNTTGFRCNVVIKYTAAPTALSINGVVVVFPTLATGYYMFTLEPGGSITHTGGTYTWTWVAM